jgi:hypothetical protein
MMATRARFLNQVWTDIINAQMASKWIDDVIAESEHKPDAPFADLGPALKRLLARGVDRRDLCMIARLASYKTAFSLLYMLDDPGVDNDDNKMMHEELLTADPSGKDGRPGSLEGVEPDRST